MEKLSNYLTDYYLKKHIIAQDKREIYCYGFKLIIADIINYALIMGLGIILNKILDSLVFLVVFCTIRQYSGGFHAKTFGRCRASFVITYLAVLCVSSILSEASVRYIALINTFCIVFMAVFAPVEHVNKPLTCEQKKKNKIRSIIASVITSVSSVILLKAGITIGATISVTLCAIIILMFISIKPTKEGNENDE